MSAHTPGPWVVSFGSIAGMPRALDDASLVVITGRDAVAVFSGNESTREANANLIAAAPDLLDAWVEFLSAQQIIDAAGFMDNYTDAARARERQQRAIVAARAAIAKAEGKR